MIQSLILHIFSNAEDSILNIVPEKTVTQIQQAKKNKKTKNKKKTTTEKWINKGNNNSIEPDYHILSSIFHEKL